MHQVLIVLILFLILFLATVDSQLLLALFPELERDLGVTAQVLGLLVSGYALTAALFTVFLGPLTDRHGRAAFLRLGLVLFALTAFGAYFSTSFGVLLAWRCLTGVGAGLISACTAGYVGDLFPPETRGKAMGAVLSSYFAALIFGVPAGAWIAAFGGWRSVFLASGASAVVLLGIAFLLPSVAAPARKGRLFSLDPYREVLCSKRNFAALCVSFAISGATLAILAYIPSYLSRTFGLNTLEISQVFLVSGVGAMIGAPVAGWLCDRSTRRGVFLTANTALVLLIPILALVGWGKWLVVLFLGISVGIAFRQTALQTLQSELTEAGLRGTFFALRNGFSQIGISTSVLVAGALYSWQGYFAVTLWAALLTLVGSLILALALPGRPES